jgi:RNA polymerase primary sigma factor
VRTAARTSKSLGKQSVKRVASRKTVEVEPGLGGPERRAKPAPGERAAAAAPRAEKVRPGAALPAKKKEPAVAVVTRKESAGTPRSAAGSEPGHGVTRRHEGEGRMKSQISQENEALVPYVKIARLHPPLGREREYELSARARKGDARARQLLVNHNVAFVLSMCRRYQNKGCRLDDLVQEGMIGLLKAVEHFDPAKGNRFSTYASWWIRAYAQKYLRDMRASVKPVITGPGQAKFALPRDFSLDAPVGDDDDTTHLDRLEDGGPSQEDDYLRGEHAQEIREALERVKKRVGGLGWDIIQQRLEQDQPRTLEEIGKEWGLSRERVRQVEKSTRSFLERYLEPFAA